MNDIQLTNQLTESLLKILSIKGINILKEFLEGELSVLLIIFQNNNKGIIPSSISDALNITRGRVTAILTSLMNKNYLKLENIEDDRRKVNVFMTEEGEQYFEEKRLKAFQYFNIFVNKMGNTKISELISTINNIVKIMEDVEV